MCLYTEETSLTTIYDGIFTNIYILIGDQIGHIHYVGGGISANITDKKSQIIFTSSYLPL